MPAMRLIRADGDARVYLTDFLTKRHLDEARYKDILTLNGESPFLSSATVRVVHPDFVASIPDQG